jgi:RimJ/RimL family protein N-acetyltransferase
VELVYGLDADVLKWVKSRYGFEFCPPCVAVGIGDGEQIVGAVVWNDYSGPNIEGSCVGDPKAFTRSIIRECFAYPFVQLNCRRVTIHVAAKNTKVHDLAKRLGFEPEGVMPHYYQDDDALLFGLLREKCRWVRT